MKMERYVKVNCAICNEEMRIAPKGVRKGVEAVCNKRTCMNKMLKRVEAEVKKEGKKIRGNKDAKRTNKREPRKSSRINLPKTKSKKS
jgi:hypothetical protein